jgi:hypothetical protein
VEKQQRRAIMVLALLGGALASVLVPALMDYLEVRSELAWRILAPGVLIFPVIHMPLESLIMIVAFDGCVYLFVSFIVAHVILRRWPEARQ